MTSTKRLDFGSDPDRDRIQEFLKGIFLGNSTNVADNSRS